MIPIFIIVHDRVQVLQKTIAGIEKHVKTPFKIILHDSKSTFPPCIAYLKELEQKGYRVFYDSVNDHTRVRNSMRLYLQEHPECTHAALTDSDIELDDVDSDILEFYLHLSKLHPGRVIGPMLRIDDLPDYYPHKKKVIASHTRQFWRHTPRTVKWKNTQCKVQNARIDTTFQLFPVKLVSRPFPRDGIRCHAPYGARHLDWYLNPQKLSADQVYYATHASKKIAHWGRNVVPLESSTGSKTLYQ